MNQRAMWIGTVCALVVAGVLAAGVASAWECTNYPERRVRQFERLARHEIARCERRAGADCPDAQLTARLDRLAARIARIVTKRCPAAGADRLIAELRATVLCEELGSCGSGTIITVSVGGDGVALARSDRAVAADASARRLRADAGWTGLTHDLQILEGASYTAELSGCDGADRLCDLHGATAGTAFGAPSPLGGGGVSFCVTVDFASDITGTYELDSGALSEAAAVDIGVYLGVSLDRPCPACITPDGDPELGEAGTCLDGANPGQPCRVEGLGDPRFGAARATSSDCGAGSTWVAQFHSRATATTGAFDFAPTAASPKCTKSNFVGQNCLCSTCDNAGAGACHSDADCPSNAGAPGICGGRRCIQGSNLGAPCSTASQCPGGSCVSAGEPIARNSCIDGICTPTGDGRGECLAGPVDTHCEVAKHYGCLADSDCPGTDRCVEENRRCSLDTIALDGTPDPPAAGAAHPTLVGGFCMGAAGSAAVNTVAGFPGPVTYVWPTEVQFGE